MYGHMGQLQVSMSILRAVPLLTCILVFTIVAAFWTKVDYHLKQLAPWRSLAAGQTSAEQSLLLDYISTWNVRVLFRAGKARQFDVSAGVAATLLLQLMIIFSTGLFALEPQIMQQPGVAVTTNFNFAYRPNVSVNSREFMTALAIQDYGLEYRHGTSEEFAYQTFNFSNSDIRKYNTGPSFCVFLTMKAPNSTVTATVDAIHADLECEKVNANYHLLPITYNSIGEGPWYAIIVNSTDAVCPPSDMVQGYEFNLVAGYMATEMTANCQDNGTTIPDQKRWWFYVAHVDMDDQNRTYVNPSTNDTMSYRDGKSSISIVACQPKIEMRKARVESDGRTMNATLVPNSSSPVTINVTGWDIMDYARASEADARLILGGTNRRAWPQGDNTTLTSMMFSLMNSTAPRKNATAWMDADFLMQSSKKAFQKVAPQVIFDYITEPADATLTGSISYVEQRLVLRSLSFYLVVSLLIVLMGIAVALCFLQRTEAVPRDPGSIAGLAAIMAASPSITRMLRGVGHSAAATKTRIIAHAPFHSEIAFGPEGQHLQIQASNIDTQSQTPFQTLSAEKQNWWRPFHITIPGMVVTLIAPLAAIATLEALYQHSKRNNGIADATTNYYLRYTWVFLPALVVWLINIGFESVYTLSTIIHPYHVLRRRAAAAEDALTGHLLSKILAHNAWSALRKRRFAVLFAALAVLLGAILPIAVAGLYTTQIVAQDTTMSLEQISFFDASKGFYSALVTEQTPFTTDRNANPLGSLILHNNLSFPGGTYDEFAFAEFEFPGDQLKRVNSTYDTVTAILPAVRGRVNCTIVPPEDIRPGFRNSGLKEDDPAITLQVNTTMADDCWGVAGIYQTFSGQFSNVERANYKNYHFGRFNGAVDTAYTQSYELGYPQQNASVNDASYHGDFVTPAHCPRGMITFGKGKYENGTNGPSVTLEDVTAMHCWPYVEHVQLNTTFSLPSMTILSANPLPPDPNMPGGYPVFSEAEIVQNAGWPHVAKTQPSPWSNYFSSIRDPVNPGPFFFDLYMEAVVWGKDGVPVSELVGQGNAGRLVARVEKVYSIMMAQIYNGQARIPSDKAVVPLTATAVSRTQYRVIQSLISTRIMEAVLAAIFVLCALAFLLLDTKELLPQNPCSIGAAASFLAGTALVNRTVMPPGSEFLSDQQMLKRGYFQGQRFRMGWWNEGGEKRFAIDVAEDAAEKRAYTSNEHGALLLPQGHQPPVRAVDSDMS